MSAIIVLFLFVAIGSSIYKFVRVRDFGLSRGLSKRDATTAAMFSDDVATAGLVLRSDPDESIEGRLRKLQDLRAKGLITAEEASRRRGEIIDDV